MNFNELEENSLIVVPRKLQNNLLKQKNQYQSLISFSMITMEELKEKVYFSIKEEATFYLMRKFHYHPTIIETLLTNLYFIDPTKTYEEKKLQELVDLYHDLDQHHFIQKDPIFLEQWKNRKVYIYGYATLSLLDEKILSFFKNKEKIEIPLPKQQNLHVYEFNTLEEEVDFVFSKILDLLSSGIPKEKIRLFGAGDLYLPEIKRLSSFFHLPFNIEKVSLFSFPIVQKYLAILEEKKDFITSFKQLEEDTTTSLFKSLIKQKLKDLVEQYSFYEQDYQEEVKIAFYEKLRQTTISIQQEDCFEIEDIENNIFQEDEFIFFLGMNQTFFPVTYKDEDYLSDRLKVILGLDTTEQKNKQSSENLMQMLNHISNGYITYKCHYLKEEYHPSHIIESYPKEIPVKSNISYSDSYSEFQLCMLLDDFTKYGHFDPKLSQYSAQFSIPYKKYNNQYRNIEKELLYQRLRHKLTLSYSSIDTFYHCPFRYYVQKILKIDSFTSSFETEIGTLFHLVLSKIEQKDFNLDAIYNSYIKEKIFSKKELLFLSKLKKELEFLIEEIKQFHHTTYLNQILCEKEFHIDKSTVIPVDFMGVIDKIMYREKDGRTYVALVDYKTGSKEMKLSYVPFGLELQLLIYLCFIKESKLFKDPFFVGFYLQKILGKEISCQEEKDAKTQKRERMKLDGYSTSDVGILEKFDITYENSEYIRSLRMTKNGFYHYAKVLSEEQINQLIELTTSFVNQARDEILEGNFKIAPKKIEDEEIGCSFCRFRDICFRTEEDIVSLPKPKKLDFLGGEKDGTVDNTAAVSD